MHVISASRRTDIPAFYAPWFVQRLREGYARVPNPFNPRQISTVDLRPEKVACIVFWTKDPRPILPHLPWMAERGYRFIFHVTVTGLPSALEPNVPPAAEVVEGVRALAALVGAHRVVWRFDPVLLTRLTPEDRQRRAFASLCDALQGCTHRVTISFAHHYRQVHARLRRELGALDPFEPARLPAAEALARGGALCADLARMAAQRGMEITSCAEPLDLAPYGVRPAPCIDAAHLRTLFGVEISPRKDPGQRPRCGCVRSIDIGIYGSCPHRCLYCYARADAALVRGERHDPRSPRLIGEDPEETEGQPRLF